MYNTREREREKKRETDKVEWEETLMEKVSSVESNFGLVTTIPHTHSVFFAVC
jgi:hypothetical protein